jgi:hypothetical protein
VDSAALEPGNFAGGVQLGNRASAVVEDATSRVGLQSLERLAGDDVESDGDQRPGRRIEELVRGGGAEQALDERWGSP